MVQSTYFVYVIVPTSSNNLFWFALNVDYLANVGCVARTAGGWCCNYVPQFSTSLENHVHSVICLSGFVTDYQLGSEKCTPEWSVCQWKCCVNRSLFPSGGSMWLKMSRFVTGFQGSFNNVNNSLFIFQILLRVMNIPKLLSFMFSEFSDQFVFRINCDI